MPLSSCRERSALMVKHVKSQRPVRHVTLKLDADLKVKIYSIKPLFEIFIHSLWSNLFDNIFVVETCPRMSCNLACRYGFERVNSCPICRCRRSTCDVSYRNFIHLTVNINSTCSF